MLLNRVEYLLMNNPLRAILQRRFEARRLLRLGGPLQGGAALEVGCGRGVGAEIILDLFGATTVDGFDLDPRMVGRARRRLRSREPRVRLWVGDVTAIAAPDSAYDAVFDFGIIHHVPDWRCALAEIRRVLKPGGRFYAEEMLRRFVNHPVARSLLEHPQADRFDSGSFLEGLRAAGLTPLASQQLGSAAAWFVSCRPPGGGHEGCSIPHIARNKDLVRRYFDAIRTGDLERIASLMAPDLRFRCAGGNGAQDLVIFSSPEELVDDLRHNLGGLYDPAVGIQPEILSLTAEQDRVAAEVRIRGRAARTGESYDNLYAFFFWVRDGAIIEVHEHLDTAYTGEKLLKPAGIASGSEMPWLKTSR